MPKEEADWSGNEPEEAEQRQEAQKKAARRLRRAARKKELLDRAEAELKKQELQEEAKKEETERAQLKRKRVEDLYEDLEKTKDPREYFEKLVPGLFPGEEVPQAELPGARPSEEKQPEPGLS